jgi:hypothetical protein
MVVLIELVKEFNEPVLVSIESTRFFKLSVVVATLELNPLVVVATLELKLTILELKSDVVVATEELKLPIEELNPDVVVATLELRLPIEELNPDVVVATLELNPLVVVAIDEDKESTLELKEPMLEDNPLVVVATELDNEPILVDILVDILELNVEYPVVPVIKTWILPDITVSVLSLFLIVVSIEPVNEFKLLVVDSIDVNRLFCVELVESFELVYD